MVGGSTRIAETRRCGIDCSQDSGIAVGGYLYFEGFLSNSCLQAAEQK
jgi:hypothetical protein